MSSESAPHDRLYDRDFALAMASQMCFVIANTLLAHYARWIEFLGGSVRDVGFVMGCGAIFGLILRPWMGQWINRLGPQTMWLIGYAVFAVGCIGNLLLYDLGPGIYLLRSCLVLGAAIVFTSSLTYITHTAPVHRQAEAIGILGSGGFIGMLLGPVLGDVILAASERVRGDFVLLFVAASLGSLVPAALVLCMRKTNVRHRGAPVTLADFFRTTARHWPGTIILVNLAFGACMTAPFVFLSSYVDQEQLRITGVSVIGLFFWCYAGWGLVIRIGLRRLPQRRGRRKVLLAGLVFMGAGMFAYALVDAAHPWRIVVPSLICGTGHALIFHTMMSLAVETFPSPVRGTGSALALMMLDMGTIVGAPLFGQIAETAGYAAMFATIGSITLFSALAYTLASIPVWQRRSAERKKTELRDSVIPAPLATEESVA
ncbi:MAG: MFS transporter [Planctomycetota bacterium]|nr:MAG: MFS transporter [Planctomycetota bacterium]REK39745.1 MAG: MFS transporter [Planctomycetota bacterium]